MIILHWSLYEPVCLSHCLGLGWNRVHFPPSSWNHAGVWIKEENNVGNSGMF